MTVVPTTTANAALACQMVRRQASERPLRGRSSPGAAAPFLSAPDLEDIARSADRVDQLLVEGVIDLRSQAPDVHIDDVGAAVEVHVPHLLGDERAGEDLALAAEEQREESELLGGQLQALPRSHRLAAHQVHLEVSLVEDLQLASGRA